MSTAPNARADRIAVVDDDARIRDLLRRYLTQEGFEVLLAEDAKALNRVLTRETVDLIVLDLMLPGEDGLSICRRLRAANDLTPIIMLTAKVEDVDRIVGLEVGADDYLPKPFNPRELLARIHAVLRRRPALEAPGAPALDAQTVTFGPFEFDLALRRLSKDGEQIPLTTGEFSMLKALVRHPRQPLSRDKLAQLARGREFEPFDRSLDVQISRLRKMIEPDPTQPRYIQTVWGVGYVFVPDGAEPAAGRRQRQDTRQSSRNRAPAATPAMRASKRPPGRPRTERREPAAGAPRRAKRVALSLFWRTFFLLAVLLASGVFAWVQTFRALEFEPRAVQAAQQIASLVNLSRVPLRSTDGINRVALIKSMSKLESVQLSPREPKDKWEPYETDRLSRAIGAELRSQLGPDTLVASSMNGTPGLFVGFSIERDPYWLQIDPTRRPDGLEHDHPLGQHRASSPPCSARRPSRARSTSRCRSSRSRPRASARASSIRASTRRP